MSPRPPAPGPLSLALALALCAAFAAASGGAARSRDAHPPRSAPATARGGTPEAAPAPPRRDTLALASEPGDENALRLGRAAVEWSRGDLRGVIENLEAIDPAAQPDWAEADRAAFLLGEAYLRMGATGRFTALARSVATWPRATVYTQWLAIQLEQLESERGHAEGAPRRPPGPSPTDRTASDSTHRTAAGDSSQGDAEDREWTRLRSMVGDTTTALGRDLTGAALVQEAAGVLARGGDPRPLLATVPVAGRYGARARHMLALAALERGDTAQAIPLLEALAADTTYPGRREVLLALAGRAIDQGRWEDAHRAYQAIERDREANADTLRAEFARRDHDALWRSWESDAALSGVVVVDAAGLDSAAAGLARASTDLTARPPAEPPAPSAPEAAPGPRWPVAPPSPDEWRSVTESRRALDEADAEAERTRWAIAREREDLASLRGYLGGGLERARRESVLLGERATLLDSLQRTLEAIDARLRSVRDQATRRLLERGAALLRGCADDVLWLEAMRLYHIQGPNRGREPEPPPGFHAPEAVVTQEEVLARAIRDLVERMAKGGPEIIARSYEQAWRPRLIDRVVVQDSLARLSLGWAHALGVAIDSSIAAAAGSDSLTRLAALLARQARTGDSLDAEYRSLRDRVARDALARALATLEAGREAADYGLALSAYGRSVRLGEARSAADDSLDDPGSAGWQLEGIARMRAFLERHPESAARGEMRFRLADLLLVAARREFREAMARHVRDQAAGTARGPLPVLGHDEPLALYRKILAEDPGFEHRDAVLFNAGMILSDEGSAEAARFFADLVAKYPDSPYGQEAWLRMGDLEFNERRYAESVPLYRHAVTGPDASLTAIALYKTGWAHYNGDRYADAADAFRGVLDLYASERRPEIRVDIEGEAEAYLVHSLVGAGGASAFAAYFDRIGPRPYEVKIALAMGQQYRRLARYPDAAAVDRLVLRRYPDRAEALLAVQRLIDTQQRSAKPSDVRDSRLAWAPAFAPGSPWFAAQTSDSVRAAGAEFARGSWKAVAREHHRRAREAGARADQARADWTAALDLYEKVLSTWPDDPEAPALALDAGEAAAQIGRYDVALRHYGAAAGSGRDSVAAQALWQRVAVTDAWYESTRAAAPAIPAGSGGARAARIAPARGLGSDSLARAELAAADELLRRFPDHPRGAEIVWRQANLAFAHGWYEDAADRFGSLATRFPADARAPRAAILTADSWFRLGRFEQAGGAYEAALAAAKRAGVDSLARRAAAAIPVAWYRNAEAAVAADSSAHARHAALFEQVATRWPEFEHAPLAQYRAGLAWLAAGRPAESVRALETLIERFPRSEFVRDAELQIARAWESADEREKSAAAFARFAERFPADTSAANATLHAADLYDAAGLAPRAEELRMGYIRRHPGDVETAIEVLEPLARRELATVSPARPVSTLIGADSAATRPRRSRAAASPAVPTPSSRLAQYLRLAAARPDLASKPLLAEVRFDRGEEAWFASDTLPLRQPLAAAIAARQKSVDRTLALYRKCVDVGVAEWSHAATYRIGRALIAFGEALEKSERPADLQGDALRAYEGVLRERSQAISGRGESVWADLVRGPDEPAADPWIARARESLWPRLGNRFFFRPELEYPEVAAEPARRIHAEKAQDERPARRAKRDSAETRTVSQREGNER